MGRSSTVCGKTQVAQEGLAQHFTSDRCTDGWLCLKFGLDCIPERRVEAIGRGVRTRCAHIWTQGTRRIFYVHPLRPPSDTHTRKLPNTDAVHIALRIPLRAAPPQVLPQRPTLPLTHGPRGPASGLLFRNETFLVFPSLRTA